MVLYAACFRIYYIADVINNPHHFQILCFQCLSTAFLLFLYSWYGFAYRNTVSCCTGESNEIYGSEMVTVCLFYPHFSVITRRNWAKLRFYTQVNTVFSFDPRSLAWMAKLSSGHCKLATGNSLEKKINVYGNQRFCLESLFRLVFISTQLTCALLPPSLVRKRNWRYLVIMHC